MVLFLLFLFACVSLSGETRQSSLKVFMCMAYVFFFLQILKQNLPQYLQICRSSAYRAVVAEAVVVQACANIIDLAAVAETYVIF